VAQYPDLYFTGYVQDALKEFTEASTVNALLTGTPVPDPDTLGVDYAAYLNGLGEAASELRRSLLDMIRHEEMERSELLLEAMEDIYQLLVTMDFPDALTGGLRRTTDVVRSVLERTRGDLTMAWRQEKLEERLRAFQAAGGNTSTSPPPSE
jgi:translin